MGETETEDLSRMGELVVEPDNPQDPDLLQFLYQCQLELELVPVDGA